MSNFDRENNRNKEVTRLGNQIENLSTFSPKQIPVIQRPHLANRNFQFESEPMLKNRPKISENFQTAPKPQSFQFPSLKRPSFTGWFFDGMVKVILHIKDKSEKRLVLGLVLRLAFLHFSSCFYIFLKHKINAVKRFSSACEFPRIYQISNDSLTTTRQFLSMFNLSKILHSQKISEGPFGNP